MYDLDRSLRRGRRTLEEAFTDRHNSLNFIRLVLAVAVVVSHASLIGGFPGEDVNGKQSLGMLAVYGFFGISGFLIAGSASRNSMGRYLWQRCLRILPGFWVCLVITAFVFGVIGWGFQSHPHDFHSGILGYFNARNGPFSFLFHDFLLNMNQNSIANTPRGVPAIGDWNGSLWTLIYEFLCYLFLGALALVGLLRRRYVVFALAGALWIAVAAITLNPKLNARYNYFYQAVINISMIKLLTFSTIFFVGALLYLFRDKVPDSGLLALGCGALFISGLWLPVGGRLPFYLMSSTDLTAPMLVYPLLWLGIHLPCQEIGARNDYSYGVYIYAYPVQQLLAIWHAERWGYVLFLLLGVAGTVPLAVASWWLIEKNALKLRKLDVGDVFPWMSRNRRPAQAHPGVARGLVDRSDPAS